MRYTTRIFLVAAAMAACCHLAAQDSQYVETNRVRRAMIKAQQDWRLTYPDLESYLLTKPKAQVLREITEAEKAARQFTSLQRQYYDRRSKEFSAQLQSLKPRDTVGDSGALVTQMKTTVDRQLENLESDQDALRRRLRELSRPGLQLSSEQILLRDTLAKEVAEIERLHLELSRQSREILKLAPAQDVEVHRQRLVEIYSQLLASTDTQRTLADQEDGLVATYYGSLRSVVDKRPDDSPRSTESTNDNTVVNIGAPPAANRPPRPVSERKPTEAPAPIPPSQPVPKFTPHYKGKWVRPERAPSGNRQECQVRSAEISLDVDKNNRITGSLAVRYERPEPCRIRREELRTTFSGTAQGYVANLVMKDRDGTVTFELREEHRALVEWQVRSGTPLPGNGKELFDRIDSPSGQRPVRDDRKEQPQGWKLEEPRKPEPSPKRQ